MLELVHKGQPLEGTRAPARKVTANAVLRTFITGSPNISQVLWGPFALVKILSSIGQVLWGPFASLKIPKSIGQVLSGPFAFLENPE